MFETKKHTPQTHLFIYLFIYLLSMAVTHFQFVDQVDVTASQDMFHILLARLLLSFPVEQSNICSAGERSETACSGTVHCLKQVYFLTDNNG
jgi:hypothetical protein